MNIVLIGYRGCGKSAVADELAERTHRDVISTDTMIENWAGCSIPEYVEKHGWQSFRDLEAGMVAEAAAKDHVIIDTGGGVILRPENVDVLKKNGAIFWLWAEVDTIRQRIAESQERPSLTGDQTFLDEIAEVLAEREPSYAAAADKVIHTDGRTIDEIADEIAQSIA